MSFDDRQAVIDDKEEVIVDRQEVIVDRTVSFHDTPAIIQEKQEQTNQTCKLLTPKFIFFDGLLFFYLHPPKHT